MFANIILLDLYNSMGLPTSTTVSLIFCLLGAAVAVSIYKISNDGALGMGDLNHFINTGRAMGIVSAILLSVVIAFTFGTLIMYISRLIFSFRYTAMFRRFGAFWCGASFTAILYFAVFKGLKTPLAGSAAIEWIDQHILLSLFLCWAVGSLLLFFLQRLKINILRLTILSGTFALALAFAGNDLVNFIGVPVAGFDAYSIARHAGDSTILMEGLNASVPANFLVLMTAGVIMIVTLWTSKKAMHVTETEISLSTQGESETQYGSSLFSRTIVRAALNASNAIDRTIPKRIRDKISSRFQYEDIFTARRSVLERYGGAFRRDPGGSAFRKASRSGHCRHRFQLHQRGDSPFRRGGKGRSRRTFGCDPVLQQSDTGRIDPLLYRDCRGGKASDYHVQRSWTYRLQYYAGDRSHTL